MPRAPCDQSMAMPWRRHAISELAWKSVAEPDTFGNSNDLRQNTVKYNIFSGIAHIYSDYAFHYSWKISSKIMRILRNGMSGSQIGPIMFCPNDNELNIEHIRSWSIAEILYFGLTEKLDMLQSFKTRRFPPFFGSVPCKVAQCSWSIFTLCE